MTTAVLITYKNYYIMYVIYTDKVTYCLHCACEASYTCNLTRGIQKNVKQGSRQLARIHNLSLSSLRTLQYLGKWGLLKMTHDDMAISLKRGVCIYTYTTRGGCWQKHWSEQKHLSMQKSRGTQWSVTYITCVGPNIWICDRDLSPARARRSSGNFQDPTNVRKSSARQQQTTQTYIGCKCIYI